MKVRAQVAMVMNLDKCIGCHTCSVTCNNVWTNRPGAEYMWFNNVETKPGIGYPQRWEDQEQWKGGWKLDRKGKLKLKAGGPAKKLANLFFNPNLPDMDDYYEPWTYDYENLTSAKPSEHQPVAQPISQVTGDPIGLKWGPNWEDDLAGGPDSLQRDPNIVAMEEEVKANYEQVFMMYLPRICEHCLNPSCVASCPSGAMYKREEDGIVLVDQEKCRGWRMCVTGCPYKKVYFNWKSGKAEKCTMCYPRIEAGLPTVCSETCVGRLRYLGLVLYDADMVEEAASTPDAKDLLDAQLKVFLDPEDPDVRVAARRDGIHDDWIEAARRSPIYALAIRYRIALPLHPGVPHDADGLVRAAAVSGHVDDRGRQLRVRSRRRLSGDRHAAHPDRVPRQPALGRRHGGHPQRPQAPRGDAPLHARAEHHRRGRHGRGGRSRHDAARHRGHVPPAGDREVRGSLRHPARAHRAGRQARRAAGFLRPGLRGRAGKLRLDRFDRRL